MGCFGCLPSQGSPVSMHFGPAVLGLTSPRLVEAKADTNGPFPVNKESISFLVRIKFINQKVQKIFCMTISL